MAAKKSKGMKNKVEVTSEGTAAGFEVTEEEPEMAETEATEGAGETPDGAAGAEGAETTADTKASDEKSTSGKKGKSDPRDEKIADLSDKLMRQMAEFENYRKRTEKEKASMFQIGAKEVLEKILPVVDNFERAFQNADEADPFVDGMQKIYKQLMTSLEEMGVEPIESVGCEFNPDFHNAVMHVEDESADANVIVEEFQKGYKYKDQIIRYSMVKVAN